MASAPAPEATGGPASPCNLVCTIDRATGWCVGCKRSLDEIAEWGGATSARKREIIAAIAGRAR